MNSEYILILTLLSVSYSFFAVLGFPAMHRILRNKLVYFTFVVFGILLPIISCFENNKTFISHKIQGELMTFYLIIFLVLYKLFNFIILKKYNRNIYFTVKNNTHLKDFESDLATWLDFVLQLSLIVIPTVLCYFIEYLFEK